LNRSLGRELPFSGDEPLCCWSVESRIAPPQLESIARAYTRAGVAPPAGLG
jgi:hypothetical protein